MKVLGKVLGLGLILLGIYFLGKNIFFTTGGYGYSWLRGIKADVAVFTLTGGLVSLFTLPKESRIFGWILIGASIVLIIAGGRAVLRPTSFWEVFISFLSMVSGYQLLRTGRIEF
ncbi:hypothetical protein NIES970_00040 [[Synechococcus] sp. NIES-970]|uniref:hypothetical protein n=1 Tax=Picosynechococcus sp. NKBG15041c TaxID=1407650 RepID=UPI000420EBD4|nr:hypothetical protein [Picosynechococcus sp. NKBG15041c]BAW95104.1 hypothetical protein NIES970_00040 [[Synechococcus] sp. NIES-970]